MSEAQQITERTNVSAAIRSKQAQIAELTAMIHAELNNAANFWPSAIRTVDILRKRLVQVNEEICTLALSR